MRAGSTLRRNARARRVRHPGHLGDADDALDAVSESFRILAQGVGPDGTQLSDERESLLWGYVNMLDSQTQRLETAPPTS